MGKRRLSDHFEFSEEDKIRRRKTELLLFPIITILIGLFTLTPVILLMVRDEKASNFIIIPILFGGFMLFNGFKRFSQNREEITNLFWKNRKRD